MKKYTFLIGIMLTILCAQAPKSHAIASFQLDATLGGHNKFQIGDSIGLSDSSTWGASLEVMPSFQFLIASADFGVMYDFVNGDMVLRPGARVYFGWLYLRAAVPLAFSFRQGVQGKFFDLGALFGVGLKISHQKFALLAEANVSPFFLDIGDNGLSMPAELRLGLSYTF